MHTTLLAWIFLSFFVVGSVSQSLAPPTNSVTVSVTNSFTNTVSNTNSVTNTVSNTNTVTNTVSNTNTITNTVSNTLTNTLTNTISSTITNTITNTVSMTVTNTMSNTLSHSLTFSMSGSFSGSVNNYAPNPGFNFQAGKRIRNIQCKYGNPNLYCKWAPATIGYKRVRLQVQCNNNQISNTFSAVYNTSTPRYQCGTSPTSQQTSLVSLDLPPNSLCQGILTLREYSNEKGKCANTTNGVHFTESRFFYRSKGTGGFFQTGPLILLTSS